MNAIDSPVVLVIEDDEHLQTLIRLALTRGGNAVVQARNAAEALAAYDEYGDAITAVLSDVEMPGVDGPSVVRRLLAQGMTAPFAFVTGGAFHYTIDDLLGLGAVAVLAKPFRVADLLTLTRWLHGLARRGAVPAVAGR